MLKSAALMGILIGLGITAGGVQAAEPFYAGKTVTFVVGQTPGGGADLTCRLLAQYMSPHIDGQPTIIVKNMPSTSSMVALNYVGKDAKNDGLTLFCGSYDPSSQLSRNPSLLVDLTKFNYITGDGESEVVYVRRDVTPGMKNPDDIYNAQGLILGGFSVDGIKDISTRLLIQTVGVKNYKYVVGFAGDAPARAALQQHFINFWQGGITSYTKVAIPTLVKTGEVMPLFQSGLSDDAGHLTRRDPRVPDLPTAAEFYQAKFGKAPSGPAWELAELALNINNIAIHALMLPPGAPGGAVDAMRAAIAPLSLDPEFVAASDTLRGAGTVQQPGSVVLKTIEGFLDMPPEQRALYQSTIKSGEELASTANK